MKPFVVFVGQLSALTSNHSLRYPRARKVSNIYTSSYSTASFEKENTHSKHLINTTDWLLLLIFVLADIKKQQSKLIVCKAAPSFHLYYLFRFGELHRERKRNYTDRFWDGRKPQESKYEHDRLQGSCSPLRTRRSIIRCTAHPTCGWIERRACISRVFNTTL